jgi:hypothetical protein
MTSGKSWESPKKPIDSQEKSVRKIQSIFYEIGATSGFPSWNLGILQKTTLRLASE